MNLGKHMKRHIRKWTLWIFILALFIAGLLLIIVLNPVLTYANKTIHNNFTIYHHNKLDSFLILKLDLAENLLKQSEFYNSGFKLDICLNDGSRYPDIIKAIRGSAFAWGFYNKVVLQGSMKSKENFVELNGYRWNLAQLLAHEMTHCLQFEKLGLWKSKPIANIDNWKWEGYAEYVSRQKTNQKDLIQNLKQLHQSEDNSWEINLEDSTITPKEYFNYWTLVQYCLDIKKRSYMQLLTDKIDEQKIRQEMDDWYGGQKNNNGDKN